MKLVFPGAQNAGEIERKRLHWWNFIRKGTHILDLLVVERLRLMLAHLQKLANSNRDVCNGVELDFAILAILAEVRTTAFCEMPAVSLDTTNILSLELSSLKRYQALLSHWRSPPTQSRHIHAYTIMI